VPELTYTPPREIDGEPDEVAAEASAQFAELAVEVARVAADTAVQIRNAWHTRQLETGVELSPDELEARWSVAPEQRTCRFLTLCVQALGRASREL
jgi:hypothetical protein